MNDKRPIGVFDSGVGGLSVLIELHKLLPKEDFIFIADQAHVPYGEKTQSQLCRLAHNISDFLIKKNTKLIVVACNTATCHTIDYLRKEFKVPFVGTVPAVKTAAEQTVKKCIGIISTPATSESNYLSNLITNYTQGVKVINIGCTGLENIVEKGDINSKEVESLLKKYLEPIKIAKADAIVLGCTHYPFLKTKIRKHVGSEVKILDSGKAIAKRTLSLLEDSSSLNDRGGKSYYFTTGDNTDFSKVASILMEKEIVAQHILLSN
ncbi:MAG: glutamate racemase [Patescibacteria group bacterium]